MKAAAVAAQATPLDADLLRRWPLPSAAGTRGKDDRGRVLVIAGSAQVPGAALLAGIAALRGGAGKLQVATADAVASLLAVRLPEAKVIAVPVTGDGEMQRLPEDLLAGVAHCDAVVLGPGMADTDAMQGSVQSLAARSQGPMVLDAGALPASSSAAMQCAVLTPHAGEMAAMLEMDVDAVRTGAADLARRHASASGSVVVLKGSSTFIAAPDGRLWVNRHGCPGLGTSGSGDVLAGLLGGLLARGASREQAACWAVYLHAAAGDRLQQRIGGLGFLAREIAGEVPGIMHALSD